MKRSSDSRLQGRRGRPASPPDKDICRGKAALGMLVAPLRPAAVDRVEGQPCLARHLYLICGDDADGGLILTEAHDSEVEQSIRSAKTRASDKGRFLRETLRPGMSVGDVDANFGYFTLLMGPAEVRPGIGHRGGSRCYCHPPRRSRAQDYER
jgi:hypothetical protein